jgi:hypothetical protein
VRRGLEPVPGRIPPLPGAGQRREDRPPEPAPAPAAVAPPPAPRAPASAARTDRNVRPREFQLDKEPRDYVDTTVHAIRLRTETSFDRSALVRGILKAVRRSGLDIAARCDSEDDVTEYLLRYLPGRAT